MLVPLSRYLNTSLTDDVKRPLTGRFVGYKSPASIYCTVLEHYLECHVTSIVRNAFGSEW
jgi:hypothetical protein